MAEAVRTISKDGSVVATAIVATDIAAEIERIHKTSAVATAALGRLSIAASLMGLGLKGEKDSLTLRMNGNGPAEFLVAVSDSHGNVKSYIGNPIIELPLNQFGKLDVAGAVGREGTFSVVKDLGLADPYVSQVPIVSGEIAEDIASYFATSEQVPTVCALGVLVNPDLTVKAAGGYLVQLLPFADEGCIDILEETIKKIKPVTQLIEDGMDAEQLAIKVLEGLEPNVLDSFHCAYKCNCSRERVARALASISPSDLRQMAEEDGKAEVCCHFCNMKYLFTKDELLGLIKK